MTKNLDKDGLRSIVDEYELFYIDIWGVIHNGINIHENAIITLYEIIKLKKDFVLLTNAPRPNKNVRIFCEKLGMDKILSNHIFSSGEAALSYLKKNLHEDIFFHVGPPRDFDLFSDFKNNKTNKIEDASYLLCTGLFDDKKTDLNYYKDILENLMQKFIINQLIIKIKKLFQ